MLSSTKSLVKMYAKAVNNDMDLVLDFIDKLNASMREYAEIWIEETMDQLEENGFFEDEDEDYVVKTKKYN